MSSTLRQCVSFEIFISRDLSTKRGRGSTDLILFLTSVCIYLWRLGKALVQLSYLCGDVPAVLQAEQNGWATVQELHQI